MITPQQARNYQQRKHIPYGAPFEENVTQEELNSLWEHGIIHMISEDGRTKYKWNGDYTHQRTYARLQRQQGQQQTRTHKRREDYDPDEED